MELKDLCNIFEVLDGNKPSQSEGPWMIGKKYFIRTVTMHNAGELVAVYPQELVLKGASWVADSGRFSEALRDPSKWNEVEPFHEPVIIGRGAVVDATVISHVITEVK